MHLHLYPYWKEYTRQSNKEKGQCFQQKKNKNKTKTSWMNFAKYYVDALPLFDFLTHVTPKSPVLFFTKEKFMCQKFLIWAIKLDY